MANPCENRLISLLTSQQWHLDRLYGEYTRQFASIFQNYNGNMSQIRKRQFDRALTSFNGDIKNLLENQVNEGFNLSNACNDDFIKDYTKGLDVPESEITKLLTTNQGAAAAFLKRARGGLSLSSRVFNLTKQTEDSMNVILQSGVLNGRSAADMARDLKQYLKQPDKRFRRIRNDQGKLILSKPGANYNPGQGVYRSSYQNALRLSRNEINIAYRTNDYNRRKKMNFIMGQEIRLSGSHRIFDICDYMVGTYPKEFKFVGFHPNCLCISTSILLPREKFKEYLGGGDIDKRHLITSAPKAATDYLDQNADKIKGLKSQPYFIKDNFKSTNNGFEPTY